MNDTVITDEEVLYHLKGQDPVFDPDLAIARLVAEGVLILNTCRWNEEWPKETQEAVILGVDCSDFFTPDSADAEEILYSEVRELYDLWAESPYWGPLKWCAVKRNVRPTPPIVEVMMRAGVWSDEMEALPC